MNPIWRRLLLVPSALYFFLAGVCTSLAANLFTSLVLDSRAHPYFRWAIACFGFAAVFVFLVGEAAAGREALTADFEWGMRTTLKDYRVDTAEDGAVKKKMKQTNMLFWFKVPVVLALCFLPAGGLLLYLGHRTPSSEEASVQSANAHAGNNRGAQAKETCYSCASLAGEREHAEE